MAVQILWGNPPAKAVPKYGKTCVECSKVGHFRKVCHSRRSRVVNEMEQEASQEYKEDNIKMVSISPVYMNKNQSMLTAKLDTNAGNNKVIILYKIHTGSNGNIMLWYIFKKLFPRVTEAELMKTIKNHIKLKTYNKTVIAQLGTCMLIINYKDNKMRCEFFAVPGNGQTLLGMPDTAAFNIINMNSDFIETACMQKKNCNTNMNDAKTSNTKHETPGVKESCTITDEDLKTLKTSTGQIMY